MPTAEEVLTAVAADRGVFPGKPRVATEFDPLALVQLHDTYVDAMGADSALDDQAKQLILLAIDAATYLHYGCKFHMADALKLGWLVDQVLGALRLAELTNGYHEPLSAYPLAAEVVAEQPLASQSQPPGPAPMSAEPGQVERDIPGQTSGIKVGAGGLFVAETTGGGFGASR